MNERDFDELAAGHALGALSRREEEALRRAAAEDPARAERLARDVETAALLGDAVDDVAPPAGVRDALLAQIAGGADASAPADPELDPERDPEPEPAGVGAARAGWGARAWFTLAASIALLLGVGAGAVALVSQWSPPAAVTALERIQEAPDAQSVTVPVADGGEATAHWSDALGESVLVTEGVAEQPDDLTYEMWFVRDDGAVSAGTFDVDGGEAVAEMNGAMQPGDVIAVTVEQAGGAVDGPTTEPIVAIPTA